MTLNTEPRLEPGRTWRDLPEEPPLGEVPEPVPIEVVPGSDGPDLPPAVPGANPRWPWVLGAAVFALMLAGLLLWSPWSESEAAPPGSESPTATTVPAPSLPETESPAPTVPLAPGEEPVAAVAESLLPSVVQIERSGGVGSGFIYDEAGLIFTAAHVVDGATEVTVTLSDGRSLPGTVLGRMAAQDVAVVSVDGDALVPAPLAVGEEVRVGQTAVAVGSPFGLEQTVTAGIISALDRELEIQGRTIRGLIQTDAAINQGNSGGPLADTSGRVIGINVAIATASGGSNGVGFAVPIETALDIAEEIRAGGGDPAPTPGSNPLEDLFGSGNPLGDLFGGQNPFGDLFGDGQSPLGDLFGEGGDPLGDLLGNGGALDDQMLNDLLGGMLDGVLPPEAQDLLDGLGGLDGLGDLGGLLGGAGPSLVEPGTLPDGYRVGDTSSTQSGDTAQQVTVVEGPEGTVTVRATAGPSVGTILDGAVGDVVTVRDRLGKIDVGENAIRLVWSERDDLAIEIIGPADLGRDTVLEIAEGLEVTS